MTYPTTYNGGATNLPETQYDTQPVGQVLVGTNVPTTAADIANMAAQNILTARGQDVSMRGQDLSYDASMQSARVQAAQIRAQFYMDAAQLGVDQATLNYQQRMGQLNAALQTVQTASQERQAAANTKLQAIQALADRSGPQDWVQYNRLLNGLGAATGQTASVDPTKFADSILSPALQGAASNIDLTALLGRAYQPYTGATNMQLPADVTSMLNVSPMAPGSVSPVRNFNDGAAMTAGSGGTGTAGDPIGGGGLTLSGPQLPYTPTGSASQPYIPQTQLNGAAADALRNDPNAWYSGVPNSQVAGLTSGQRALLTTGPAGPSKVGDYSGYNVYLGGTQETDPNYNINPGTPIWLQKLARGGYMQSPIAIVGEGRNSGRSGLGHTGEIVVNPTHAPLGVLNHDQARAMLAKDVTPKQPAKQAKNAKKGRRGGPPAYANGTMKRVPGYASGTYVGIDPTTLQYTTYDPSVLASQPFIQKLSGQQASTPFRGVGSQIAAPDLGIYNFDPRLNLQNYMQFDPSEQDMTQGLYGGLGLDFRDFLKQAQAAAPTTSDYSSYGMRQQPTMYGG